jgi:hypothetical protein
VVACDANSCPDGCCTLTGGCVKVTDQSPTVCGKANRCTECPTACTAGACVDAWTVAVWAASIDQAEWATVSSDPAPNPFVVVTVDGSGRRGTTTTKIAQFDPKYHEDVLSETEAILTNGQETVIEVMHKGSTDVLVGTCKDAIDLVALNGGMSVLLGSCDGAVSSLSLKYFQR